MSFAERSVQIFDLSVTSRGVMRLSPRLRETYLTPEQEEGECLVQAQGDRLAVFIESTRENVRISLPYRGFATSRAYEQSIHRWGVNIARFIRESEDDHGVPLQDSEGRPTVEAMVETYEVAP